MGCLARPCPGPGRAAGQVRALPRGRLRHRHREILAPGRNRLLNGRIAMSYLAPSEFVTKMVDAGEAKIFMSTKDTLIRSFMAGATLALAAAFAITINVQTGEPLA